MFVLYYQLFIPLAFSNIDRDGTSDTVRLGMVNSVRAYVYRLQRKLTIHQIRFRRLKWLRYYVANVAYCREFYSRRSRISSF